jgi:hypothetical protein
MAFSRPPSVVVHMSIVFDSPPNDYHHVRSSGARNDARF